MRFKSLGSGSSGNATVVESSGLWPVRVLIDCGLGIRQLEYRLQLAGLDLRDIDAVFITHEHSDHVGCVQTLALKYAIPVWMSRGTHAAMGGALGEGQVRFAHDGQKIDLGGLELQPFAVPHDAREPLQLACFDGQSRLGIATDLGHAPEAVLRPLAACDALIIECNHDTDLLHASPYPAFLKRRVAGDFGHLSNAAAGRLAQAVGHARLQHLVAAHLSLQNNLPRLAQQELAKAVNCLPGDIVVADAAAGTPWLST
jgi:phosphoribosyl 1,2-cyclic phosphodiesterase